MELISTIFPCCKWLAWLQNKSQENQTNSAENRQNNDCDDDEEEDDDYDPETNHESHHLPCHHQIHHSDNFPQNLFDFIENCFAIFRIFSHESSSSWVSY